jgi:MFS family permease
MVLINFGRNSVAMTRTQYLVLDEGFDVSSRLLSHIVNTHSVAIFLIGLVIGRLSRRMSDGVLLLWGSLAAAVSLLGFALAGTLATVFASSFLTGVSDVVILASSYSYASRLIPALHRGKQFALYNATLFLSWGVGGTLVAGPTVDLMLRSGATQELSYRLSFVTAAVLVVAGMLVLAGVNRMRPPQAAEA